MAGGIGGPELDYGNADFGHAGNVLVISRDLRIIPEDKREKAIVAINLAERAEGAL